MDYIESLSFVGVKHTDLQALQWPRDRVIIDGYSSRNQRNTKAIKKRRQFLF